MKMVDLQPILVYLAMNSTLGQVSWVSLFARVFQKIAGGAMADLEYYRKYCLNQQTELRRVMAKPELHVQAKEMFFKQHAMLHSARMAGTVDWSYEDALLDDMSADQIRRIPHNKEHSVAWCIWHMARIEDVAMNLLVAGAPQVFTQDQWQSRLNVTNRTDTGNAMDERDVSELSEAIDIPELRAYRLAVGCRTREIVQALGPGDLKQKVDPARLEWVMAEGALVEAAVGIKDYWGKRDFAGLLLMPASRHLLVHLNEALQLKVRVQKK